MIVDDDGLTPSERSEMDNNERLKEVMYQHHIPQWKLANKLGVSELTVHRKLRVPMKEELYADYLSAINEIIKENVAELTALGNSIESK